ncbi:hypothetical protein HK096_000048, partial [Nowakowskiella sp. JEL0078]
MENKPQTPTLGYEDLSPEGEFFHIPEITVTPPTVPRITKAPPVFHVPTPPIALPPRIVKKDSHPYPVTPQPPSSQSFKIETHQTLPNFQISDATVSTDFTSVTINRNVVKQYLPESESILPLKPQSQSKDTTENIENFGIVKPRELPPRIKTNRHSTTLTRNQENILKKFLMYRGHLPEIEGEMDLVKFFPRRESKGLGVV